MPRQPILSVLGHVDSGKTSLLDIIRESQIVEGEEGGITQMIGATEVPLDTIDEVCGDLLERLDVDVTVPGLLFIDTPGHAAFSSLRKRGGSISDIAILVVDSEEGIQPQTEEAIQILKESETPFIIALNKIDLLHGWKSNKDCFMENLQLQSDDLKQQLDDKIYNLMSDFHEHGITIDRFDRVDNFQKKVAVVPISAKTGEGIPELLMVVTGLAQNYLEDDLEVEEGIGKGTVLEVSKEEGMGKTIDVIHYDGVIRSEDKLVYGSFEDVKETDIRSLMQPRPLEEIRLDKKYERVEKVLPASGIKISGKDLEGVMSGAPIRVAPEEELEDARKQVREEMKSVSFDTRREGIVVKADSLGSLEAVMRELEKSEIPVSKAEVGNVTKKDVIEASNQERKYSAVIAFNNSIDKQAGELFQERNVEIFRSGIIYELIEGYNKWQKELEEQKREKALEAVSRPAKIRVLEERVFRSSNPAVVGVKIEQGVLNPGTMLINQDGETIGRVKSVQEENDSLDKAVKGDQVAVSISNATVGRDFEEGEILLTDLDSKNYRRLQELDEMLGQGEINVMNEVVDIKDSIDPHWKL